MATPSIPSASSLSISAAAIRQLDLTPLEGLATLPLGALLERSDSLSLAFEWPRSPEDPRELSEIAEVRLWSLRADALHPWLPLLLERSGGQLTRHVAMLLPHGFSRSEGIRFAAESLELWITHRLIGLEDMDEILVMDQGTIVERGTHAGLLKQAGLYSKLWGLQFF